MYKNLKFLISIVKKNRFFFFLECEFVVKKPSLNFLKYLNYNYTK